MRSKDEYPAREIEEKWQKWWNDKGLYLTKHPPRQKYYVLEMFPYPSGDLHMGHLKNYVIGDVVARVKIMEGYDILHPMGWDSFGLPAENAAIKKGVDPKKWTENNINTYRNTLKKLGISYDWTREIATSDPDYYRWTQWIFLFLYKKGLAYRKKDYVNWCPNCKTVLANEQVIDGKCERCKTPVVKKELEQWFFKITDYAERLLEDLKELEGKWPPQVLKLQENWIGRSEGCEIVFELEGKGIKLPVFTTRADTLFGVTFMTIAPEHHLLPEIIEGSPHREEVEEYVRQALLKSEAERTKEEREKTGVFTGKYAIHPFTGEKIPIWVGDYVLANYGTGIVMGVPAHDQRDFEFAKKYGLPIRVVIKPEDGDEPRPEEMEAAFEDYGVMINSGEFTGLPSREGIERVASRLREMG
ncbi:MAG: leucine--tRNA ligase, partial [Candidatus Hydrothermota bacterium]